MFYYLKGALAKLDINFAVIDCAGVGYKLTISGTSHEALGRKLAEGSEPEVKLYTHLAVREDDVELFGFATETELSTFRMLISVSGVGPKAAMAILSILTPEKFALAACTNDTKAISKASGVGAKTAARIVLELHDKLQKQMDAIPNVELLDTANGAVGTGINKGKLAEAQDALMVLGYSRSEASSALKNIDATGLDLEGIIKAALKNLMRI